MPDRGHYSTADYVNQLFDRLDAYRQRRARLLTYALYLLLTIPVGLAMFRLVRASGAVLMTTLLIAVALGALIGLRLLSSFISNEVYGRELEREVREFRVQAQFGDTPKAKRKVEPHEEPTGHYVVGPDGELIELFDEEPENQRAKKR